MGEPNAGAVLRAVMAVTTFRAGGNAPGDVDDDVTLTLLSQRPMMFQDSEVEVKDRVGGLDTAVDHACGCGLSKSDGFVLVGSLRALFGPFDCRVRPEFCV